MPSCSLADVRVDGTGNVAETYGRTRRGDVLGGLPRPRPLPRPREGVRARGEASGASACSGVLGARTFISRQDPPEGETAGANVMTYCCQIPDNLVSITQFLLLNLISVKYPHFYPRPYFPVPMGNLRRFIILNISPEKCELGRYL